MLIHRQTEQEAKDAAIRTLAGSEAEAARQVLCKEPPPVVAESSRGQPLIHLIGADEIVQIFIPYGPRGHTVHAGPGDHPKGRQSHGCSPVCRSPHRISSSPGWLPVLVCAPGVCPMT